MNLLLPDGFQDEEPNDRMIGKLCDYAAKNPLRIPKVLLHKPSCDLNSAIQVLNTI